MRGTGPVYQTFWGLQFFTVVIKTCAIDRPNKADLLYSRRSEDFQ